LRYAIKSDLLGTRKAEFGQCHKPEEGGWPLEIEMVELCGTNVVAANGAWTAKNIPGDLILWRQWATPIEGRGTQGVESLLEELGMRGLRLEDREKSLPEVKIDRIPADAEKPTIERFPESNTHDSFDVIPRERIDLLHILVVVTGFLVSLRPIQKQIGASIEKKIRVQNQVFVLGCKANGIEKLEKEIVPGSITPTGRIIYQQLIHRLIRFLPGDKPYPRQLSPDAVSSFFIHRSIFMEEDFPPPARKILQAQDSKQPHLPCLGRNQKMNGNRQLLSAGTPCRRHNDRCYHNPPHETQ
jgi:hypothetical protein